MTRLILLAASLFIGQCLAQTIQPPRSIAEAAGRYAGATVYFDIVKGSPCGFALRQPSVPLRDVISSEITPLFPAEKREEISKALSGLQEDMRKQGASMFSSMYSYYTQRERQSHETACGLIAANAITTRKLLKESMQSMAYRR